MPPYRLLSRPTAAAGLTALLVTALAACGGSKHHSVAAPPSPSPSASPTPTATRVVCPLTGLPPTSGQDPKRVALAVKVDNIDQARPQAGLNRADLVVEELVEGGLTRLFAVFQCNTATVVGPIRSARNSDADMLAMLRGAVFAYSGANPRAIPPIRAHGNAVLISNDDSPQYFYRDTSRPAPHNVFSSTARLLAAGLSRRHGLTAPPTLFSYLTSSADASASPSADASASPSASTSSPAASTPATAASMSWPQASAAWAWNGSAWLRTQNGSRDVLADGSRVSAANVVILQVRLASSGIRDVAGNPSPIDVTVGTGAAWVLTDGTLQRGTWRRSSRTAALQLLDGAHTPIRLRPGRTWIELLPTPRTPRIH